MRPTIIAGVLVAALAAPASAQEARKLTLSDAVRVALEQSPDLAISEKSVDASRARMTADKRRRLPALTLESTALRWNEELGFDLPTGRLVAREQVTTTSSLTATLPLSAQLVINKLIAADRADLRASEEQHAATRLELASGVASAYLGVLLAREARDIAQSRTALVQAQLERARVLVEGGVLGRVDVMRLEAALAAARRQAISAASDAESAADALSLLVGVPEGTAIEPVDDLPPAAAPPIDAAAAVELARQRRPELRVAGARADQARAAATVQKANLFPNVVALGTVQHNTGNGPFMPEDAWFVGLRLDWTFWDFGVVWNQYKAADHQAIQARMAADRAVDRLRVEVRKSARDARAAFDALDVAKAGLAASEEAFRIQEARFQEGATTTTELLSAETEVTQARIGFATARYAYFIQLAALAQATGQLPDALLRGAVTR
ncbi:MAG TPA: TolC family protein [Kofleriaceae bacterium]|nr:TolC family protein [Kofleriaceae bacterium]